MLSVLVYTLFPKWTDGLFVYILKIIFYMLLLSFGAIIIDSIVDYIVSNWRITYLSYIDEREHAQGNSIANVTRFNLIALVFRLFHKFSQNKTRFFYELYYIFLEDKWAYIGGIFFLLLLLSFIGFMIF